ncbi:uncharacterized protein PADG_04607 [Paracoccidioides brasiliensis Pb18]|uniref:Uncharacterized protein n=1 Tax=Paracoccidioides brasiliensis (strain Pb18) TaxID=502780 RepID=C1GC85_PARBD|nr:uncharacterized protein PADG_04607 [Paracoccidioides brasiliensis Pb18]EEH48528.2 hypothetical protein PADG_04607 [Paracoccidioides brasiliensis Pb18]
MGTELLLEAKGPDRPLAVAIRQACYDVTHISKSDDPENRSEYIMTQHKGWSMMSDLETFRQGAVANERLSTTSWHQTTSDLTLILDDFDESTEPDEYRDAQWSFAAPIKHGEEEPRENPKALKIRAPESPWHSRRRGQPTIWQ